VSLSRLRKFLGRSHDVNALIRLESEIAQREADLASLRAQQDYLDDQTSLATLTVTLQRPPAREPVDAGDAGFLAGFSGGWRALTGVLVVAVTVVGAVLPFALVAALLGVPLALALRAARRRRPVTAPPAAPTTPA
jgi:Flp pilus assembly protein TadB